MHLQLCLLPDDCTYASFYMLLVAVDKGCQ